MSTIHRQALDQPRYRVINMIKMKSLHLLSMTAGLILAIPTLVLAGPESLNQFKHHQDIGAVKQPGSVDYDAATQTYTISGSGANMWYGEDELHYLWRKIEGDFIVRAKMEFIGKGTDPHRKIGWNVRKSLDGDAANIHATIHGDGLTSLQFRETAGADTFQYIFDTTSANIIQLERRGDVYIMSVAKQGEEFQVSQVSHVKLGDDVYVGLSTCAHNADIMEQAKFSNVRIIIPAANDFQPYRDYIGSNLELMDMESLNRTIIHRSPYSLQAPNWTRDGKTLIYNSKGLLYNFDLETNTPSVLNTGFANDNNNDHVLSWDGKSISISHHNADDERKSTIYILPLGGSDQPRQVTAKGAGHSYLHGYSVDDENLVFTGNRKDKYDIYAVNIKSGEETQLTDTATLDDGPEYSPDGQYVYFNSNRTGHMQIWRMDVDGSDQQQLTHDRYDNWFPHISPDGKTMVILSFTDLENSSDHPFYRHVYLRSMPVDGSSKPIVIAYIYGGQGTINVPSWSPDGETISFISNTIIGE